MAVTKDEILLAIKREAAANGGVPLGKGRFHAITGIRQSSWLGRYWARWSDAVAEAGFAPNTWSSQGSSDRELVQKLAVLALALGHYPTSAERNLFKNTDPTFPRSETFEDRLGNRQTQLTLLRDFALANVEFSPVYDMVGPLLPTATLGGGTAASGLGITGSIYLMKSGAHYKIGYSSHVGRRSYEVALQLPEKLVVVHEIDTDDPEGIEAYWHSRFASKRANGEWFTLTEADVAAFKRRKSFM